MAGGVILNNIMLIEELENEQRRHQLKINQRQLRNMSNPFELPNSHFLKYFRLSKDSALYLINHISPLMIQQKRVHAIPKTLKILTALHFYGHGGYQFGIGQTHILGMSQPSVSRCISEVTGVIIDHLLVEWIKFPNTPVSKVEKKRGFMQKFGIPGVIGAIDCTHISIIAPPAEDPNFPGRVYYYRKGYTSINTQIICDSECTILNINARFPGSTHDSAIWATSNIRRHLQQEFLNGDDSSSSYLIGDSGYPLQPWLLTPIENALPGTGEELYNTQHIRARNTIERLNGILKSRFRCLLRHRTLNYGPVKSGEIIYACAVLHNISKRFNDDLPNDDLPDDHVPDEELPDENRPLQNLANNNDHNWHAEGERIRNNLLHLIN